MIARNGLDRLTTKMTNDPRLTALAASLPATVPFVGPEAQERARGTPFAARLGANENGFGPSPAAISAMTQAASEAWMYADPESHDLREAVAAHHGIDPKHIMVGEGIDTLLGLVVRLFVGLGDSVVTSAGAYPTFNYHVTGFGGNLHTVPYTGDFEDPERLIEKATNVAAKLIYIANPDNPMGSCHAAKTIKHMINKVPTGTLLVLDEAYIELASADAVPDIDPNDPRVVRMRTFSKGYGMAGARVGYAIGHPDIINAFNKVRNHFGMSRIGQAGALAALMDQVWMTSMREKIADSRASLGAIALDNGLIPLESATNFVTIDCGRDGDFAKAILSALIARNIFVRMPFIAPQNRCIRVSCGPATDMSAFARALPDALRTAEAAFPA
jgi:histidinol-phosphate aminotransferase